MLQTRTNGTDYHDITKHSYLSVSIDPNYVDASTQPTPYKVYPRFYRRFPLEPGSAVQELIHLSSAITFEKTYRDGPYSLRVNPSAGALYPTEIYVQIRGVRGLIDGIYHLEVPTRSLTLIYELLDDGLEGYLCPNQMVKGLIFLVSCVYYRSSWKYKHRSLRYCFLDSGHHLGAIEAAAHCHQQAVQVIFDIDKLALNQDLGFENKEWVTACAIAGETKAKPVRRLRTPLPFVAGTDYFEPNPLIEAGYRETLQPHRLQAEYHTPQFPFTSDRLRTTILQRRSARRFRWQSITSTELTAILKVLEQPLPTRSWEDLTLYLVINRVEGLEPGLYQGMQGIKAGDFSQQMGYLCVNQAIARDSAVTLFIAAHYHNYQTALQLAGWLGQRLYLASHSWEIGCSGIGAYYDDETQKFLETDQQVLYALAIGK